jgi:hypothetical protein
MASMQRSREERAQSAAQKAADELHAARREEAPASPRGGGGGGILGSVQESARSAMGTVKDTFSGGGRGVDGMSATAGDYAEEGKAKARGAADAAADRARGAMDAAAEKARGARDAAADRTKLGGDEPEEEDVMLRVKDADQMTGQAFNDVGPMGEEGTGMPRRR